MDERDLLAERFEANRTHLRAVGYRMLGSLSEADDAVQEAWLRLSGSGTLAFAAAGIVRLTHAMRRQQASAGTWSARLGRLPRGRAFGDIRDCDPPPVKTCFAVGAVLRVCEVFRFLLAHQSLGVTLVLLLLVRARSVIRVGECFSMAATKQEWCQSSRWKCR